VYESSSRFWSEPNWTFAFSPATISTRFEKYRSPSTPSSPLSIDSRIVTDDDSSATTSVWLNSEREFISARTVTSSTSTPSGT